MAAATPKEMLDRLASLIYSQRVVEEQIEWCEENSSRISESLIMSSYALEKMIEEEKQKIISLIPVDKQI